MSAILKDLEHILSEEQRIFEEVYRLEEEKSDAIIERDGNLLQNISNSQEKNLTSIEPLELSRNQIINEFRRNHGLQSGYFITLKDIVSTIGIEDEKVTELGKNLNKTLEKIKSLQETNSRLLNDNLQFYNTLVKEVKDSYTIKTGYSKEGTENEEVAGSLILNRTI